MANIETTVYGEEGFLYGNNISEGGRITTEDDIEKGSVLVRKDGKEWKLAAAADIAAGKGLGLSVDKIEAGTSVSCDIVVSGKVNRNYVKVSGVAITDAQADILRGQGIIAVETKSLDK